MARVLSTAFCVALLAATAGAFALTQGTKTELVPIYGTKIDKVFSPTCGCPTSTAAIDFRLRSREHVSVWVERNRKRVATIVPGHTYPRGPVALAFNGIASDGTTLPDGTYIPVVRIGHRTIRLPNPIELDTKPPVVRVRHRIYTHISPDGDRRHDVFRVAYSVNEHAHGILYVDGKQVEFTYKEPLEGVLTWNGKIGNRLARPGNHVLSISAQDLAGNRAKPFPFAVVAIRYVSLGRTHVLVKPHARFALLVLSDAVHVDVLFNGRRVTARPGTLHLRAPAKTGVYRLYVTANGHSAKADVVVG